MECGWKTVAAEPCAFGLEDCGWRTICEERLNDSGCRSEHEMGWRTMDGGQSFEWGRRIVAGGPREECGGVWLENCV